MNLEEEERETDGKKLMNSKKSKWEGNDEIRLNKEWNLTGEKVGGKKNEMMMIQTWMDRKATSW